MPTESFLMPHSKYFISTLLDIKDKLQEKLSKSFNDFDRLPITPIPDVIGAKSSLIYIFCRLESSKNTTAKPKRLLVNHETYTDKFAQVGLKAFSFSMVIWSLMNTTKFIYIANNPTHKRGAYENLNIIRIFRKAIASEKQYGHAIGLILSSTVNYISFSGKIAVNWIKLYNGG